MTGETREWLGSMGYSAAEIDDAERDCERQLAECLALWHEYWLDFMRAKPFERPEPRKCTDPKCDIHGHLNV
jgi:hypothetical protein